MACEHVSMCCAPPGHLLFEVVQGVSQDACHGTQQEAVLCPTHSILWVLPVLVDSSRGAHPQGAGIAQGHSDPTNEVVLLGVAQVVIQLQARQGNSECSGMLTLSCAVVVMHSVYNDGTGCSL